MPAAKEQVKVRQQSDEVKSSVSGLSRHSSRGSSRKSSIATTVNSARFKEEQRIAELKVKADKLKRKRELEQAKLSLDSDIEHAKLKLRQQQEDMQLEEELAISQARTDVLDRYERQYVHKSSILDGEADDEATPAMMRKPKANPVLETKPSDIGRVVSYTLPQPLQSHTPRLEGGTAVRPQKRQSTPLDVSANVFTPSRMAQDERLSVSFRPKPELVSFQKSELARSPEPELVRAPDVSGGYYGDNGSRYAPVPTPTHNPSDYASVSAHTNNPSVYTPAPNPTNHPSVYTQDSQVRNHTNSPSASAPPHSPSARYNVSSVSEADVISIVRHLNKPAIEITKFGGIPLEYKRFMRQFETKIVCNTDNDDERLHCVHKESSQLALN